MSTRRLSGNGPQLSNYYSLRTSEIHLFYNLQVFYWHFLEILWLFIFLVLYFLITASIPWKTSRILILIITWMMKEKGFQVIEIQNNELEEI